MPKTSVKPSSKTTTKPVVKTVGTKTSIKAKPSKKEGAIVVDKKDSIVKKDIKAPVDSPKASVLKADELMGG